MKPKTKYVKILDAAYQLLASGNFQNMTTARIAEAAGVAEGTLYRYFHNKRQLLFHVLTHSGEKFKDVIFSNVDKTKTFRENLGHFADEFHRSLADQSPIFKIMYKAFSELDDPEIFPALRAYYIEVMDDIRDVFIWAREKDEIRLNDSDIDLVVQSLWGIADGFMKRVVLNINLPVKRAELDYTVNIIASVVTGEAM